MSSPTNLGRAAQLQLAARPLKPVRMPWYVHQPHPANGTPAPGWYWQPAGAEGPVYLGYSFVAAVGALAIAQANAQGEAA